MFANEHYGIDGPVDELPSERDQNFRVSTPSETYVLKIAAASEAPETLLFQNEAMEWLNRRLTHGSSPRVLDDVTADRICRVTSSNGTEHYVRMVTYVPGKVFADVNPHSTALLRELGCFVGRLSEALDGFSSPAAQRELYWDLAKADSVIESYLRYVEDEQNRRLVSHFLELYRVEVSPRLPQLRTSVIHNDANDHNVVVQSPHEEDRSFGILDFGDMIESKTVFEVAVAATYAMLGKANPLAAAVDVVSGYHSVYPLLEEELVVLFPSICARLAMSVVISAYQHIIEPENEYLLISQEDAWSLLRALRHVHPRMAYYLLRGACGMPPCPSSDAVVSWLARNQKSVQPILSDLAREGAARPIDLSVGSLYIPTPDHLNDNETLSEIISGVLGQSDCTIGVGQYCEPRLFYTGSQYREWDEERTVHLGMDFFTPQKTPVFAPLDGHVHSVGNNQLARDNGPTLVLEHSVDGGDPVFYTLYAHLSWESIKRHEPGTRVGAGEQIAEVGGPNENGGWPPHLHFQVICDLLDMQGDFRGVAAPSTIEVWKSISPDPNHLLGLDPLVVSAPTDTLEEILKSRSVHIGSSLSISYARPLKIVRGYMQYLYDEWGRMYLDAVNNVPHVGHSNPAVVKALASQAAVLNTNTRYLHESLTRYAERLCSKFPEPLSVCYFVNSGSEANELALRLARTHTRREDVIVIDGAYHGNTGELINLSPYKFSGPGGRGLQPHVHVVRMPDTYRGAFRAEDSDAARNYSLDVKSVADENTATFLCEPLMGCGGQIEFPAGYLEEAFTYARAAGAVCIVDEVQTGFGRVGTHFWGFETQDVVPDIVTLGKPIGNGHPLGAVITTPEIARSFANGMEFFSTTGGNPVSCAVGMAVLDEIERRRLQQQALEVGNHLLEHLRALKDEHMVIGDVRGRGLFIGVELVKSRETLEPLVATYVIDRMKELGILVSLDGPLRNVVKIKPPLVFTKEDADELASKLDKVLAEDPVSMEYDSGSSST